MTEEETKDGKENPLDLSDRYYLACKYCLEDKIPELFEQVFKRFKESVSDKSRSDIELKKRLLEHIEETNLIEAFWSSRIDKESGKLKEYKPVEGLQEAIKVNSSKNWAEGIEFFYNKLQSEPSTPKKEKDDLLIEAALSAVRGYKEVDTIEFCLCKMGNEQKKKLLERDDKENKYYAILSALRDQYCFDSFQDLINYLEYNNLTPEKYELFLSSISDQVLKNPDLAEETKKHLMGIWRHESFEEHRKYIFSNDISIIKDSSMLFVIADLIVNLHMEKRDSEKGTKEREILEILKYVDNTQVQEITGFISRKLKVFHGVNDLQLVEQLFSKLGKTSPQDKKLNVGDSSDGPNIKGSLVSQDKKLDVGDGDVSSLPQSKLSSTTDALCNIKLSSPNK